MVRSDDDVNISSSTHARKLPEFPGEHPQQHSFKDWLEVFHDEIAMRRLQPALRGELPFRVQGLRNWPAELVSVPRDVAARLDAAGLFKAKGDAAQRLKENEKNNHTIRVAAMTDSTELFTIITETMVQTAPLLRDNLRSACKVAGTEFYDGKQAYDLVIAHVQALAREGTDADYYQTAEELMRKAANRLPSGCTASEFATRVRNFVHKVNPNLDRPYVGDAIGKFIINLMPAAYEEAGERILADLKRRGKLSDPAEVSRECLTVVNKRARQNVKLTTAFALGDAATDTDTQMAAGVKRKPDGWEPNLKNEFCPGCPHENDDCYSDPRKTPNLPETILRRHNIYDRIAKRREENARRMKIRAKPMPPKKGKAAPSAGKKVTFAPNDSSAFVSDVDSNEQGDTDVQAAMTHDDWFDGLIDVAQFPVIDGTVAGAVRRSSRLAGNDVKDNESTQPGGTPSPDEAADVATPTEEYEPYVLSKEKFFVVYQGKATGVVAGTFEQVRNSHFKNYQDPDYEEYDTMEEATQAWDRHCQRELRQPPSLIPRATSTIPSEAPASYSATTRDARAPRAQPSCRVVDMMNFEAPVMTIDDQQVARVTGPSVTTGAPDRPNAHDANQGQIDARRDSSWSWSRRGTRESSPQFDKRAQHLHGTGAQPKADETLPHLMGAAVGWIVLLIMMLPCAYLIGAGYLSLTRGGSLFMATATIIASSAATVAAGTTGVDGLIRATVNIFQSAGGAMSHFIRQPTSLAPWAIVLLVIVLMNTAASESTQSNSDTKHALRRSEGATIVAMSDDQGIFDLVTPREAQSLLDEISLLHRGTRVLVLGDSCAASGVGNRPDQFLEGTLRDAVTVVNTAGGEVTCSQRGTLAVKIITNKGPMVLTVEDAILNTACPYILIPVGKLSRTKGIELYMPPWGKDGHFQYPNGVRIRMVNRNVWVVANYVEGAPSTATTDEAQVTTASKSKGARTDALPIGVVQGKRLANHTLGGQLIHAAWGHQNCQRLRWLHCTLQDVPARWGEVAAAQDGPCDVCLRAVARKQPGSGHFPSDGGLVAFDVWHCSIPFVHGRHRLVIGFVHVVSGRTKSYLMRRHTDGPRCIQEALAYFSALGISVTWMHTDGALTLIQEGTVAAYLRERGVRRTTRTPGYSRQNPMEPRWSPLREVCRKNIVQSRLPSSWWAYAWMDGEEALALTPSIHPPHHCPQHTATGYMPKGAHRRPFGCLAYVPHPGKTDKVGDSGGGIPGVLLGYAVEIEPDAKPTAPCYHVWCPSLGRIVRESTVRMVPQVFPGLDPLYFPRLAGGGAVDINGEVPVHTTSETLIPELEPYVDTSRLAEFDTTLEFRQYSGDFRLPATPITGHPLVDGEDVVTEIAPRAPLEQRATTAEPLPRHEGGNIDHGEGTIAQRLGSRRTLDRHPYARRADAATAVDKLSGKLQASHAFLADVMNPELDGLGEWQTAALATIIEAEEDTRDGKKRVEKRKEYAALMLLAAIEGVKLPAYDVTFVNVHTNEPLSEECVWDSTGEGQIYRCDLAESDLPLELVMACKSKADPDVYSERQCRSSQYAKEFEHAGWAEIANLDRFKAIERVTQDDPRVVKYLARGKRIIDTMMLGKIKRNEKHEVDKFKGRCVLRGDQMTDLSANATFSPALAESDFNCVEAVKAMRGMNEETFDAVGAYLQGNRNESEIVVARAPRHYREFDEHGNELVWILTVPLYGQADAGAIWNRTWDQRMRSDVEGYSTDEAAPCVYAKVVGPNSDERVHVPLYVDDGKICSDDTPAARAEHARLKSSLSGRFQIEFKEGLNPEHTLFLAKNVHRRSAHCTSICGRTYIEKIAARYLDGKLDTYPKAWRVMPADKTLEQLFTAAVRQRQQPDRRAQVELRARVGAIGYIVPQRPDVAYPWNVLSSCIIYASDEFVKAANRILVYLMATKDLPITYSRETPHACQLVGRADANFTAHRSTSGRVIMYGGATVMHRAQKQHCIAMSTCESELMALSSLALDMLYVKRVLTHLGVTFDEPGTLDTQDPEALSLINRVDRHWAGVPSVETDSKGAYDLCHKNCAGASTRHVERRVFKMRELNATKQIRLGLVPTHLMYADILTKVLDLQAFRRCRAALMNLEAVGMG